MIRNSLILLLIFQMTKNFNNNLNLGNKGILDDFIANNNNDKEK